MALNILLTSPFVSSKKYSGIVKNAVLNELPGEMYLVATVPDLLSTGE
jgi:hypothetical protein